MNEQNNNSNNVENTNATTNSNTELGSTVLGNIENVVEQSANDNVKQNVVADQIDTLNVENLNSYHAVQQPSAEVSVDLGSSPANPNSFVEQPKKENIGMTPPMRPEEKKKSNPVGKVLFVLLILALMAGVAYGVYYYLSLANSKKSISVTLKELTLNMNNSLPTVTEEYATITGTDSKSCVVDTTKVDITKVGTYEYTLACGENSYNGKINIVDKELPTVILKDVIVKVGTDINVEDFIESCSKNECAYQFVNREEVNSNLTTAGKYTVKIKVTDSANNVSEVESNLVVIENDIRTILECKSKENIGDASSLTIIDRIVIADNLTYGGYATRTHNYKFVGTKEYEEATKQKGNNIEYDGIKGKANYDRVNNTLSISNPLSIETLNEEAGGSFPTEYTDIMFYYVGLGYKCSPIK